MEGLAEGSEKASSVDSRSTHDEEEREEQQSDAKTPSVRAATLDSSDEESSSKFSAAKPQRKTRRPSMPAMVCVHWGHLLYLCNL